MAPRCPECGRFVSTEFVQGLLIEPGACPACGTVLSADRFEGSEALQQAPEPLATSVRPPDLPPESVRPATDPEERDVLAGWDAGPHDVVHGWAGTVRSGNPVPQVALVVGAGVAGGLLGALVGGRRRRLGAVLGTLAGAGTAAVVGARRR